MYAAVLDACVLVPTALCDTLLRLAEAAFYRPLWSDRILGEVQDAIMIVRPDLDEARVERRIATMASTFEDASVTGWEAVSAGLDLPDPDDRHVLAAAITGGAQAIVTFNLKDFPAEALHPRSIQARHPDDFLLDQLDLLPSHVLELLSQQAADLQHPRTDLAGVLAALQRCGVPNFAEAVRRMAPDDR